MKCRFCEEQVPEARARLGYTTCLAHGAQEAKLEIEQKAKRVAPSYNKGPRQYLGSGKEAKAKLLDVGRKDTALGAALPVTIVPPPKVRQKKKAKRLAIGSFWRKGEQYVWWEGQRLPKDAERATKYPQPIVHKPRLMRRKADEHTKKDGITRGLKPGRGR